MGCCDVISNQNAAALVRLADALGGHFAGEQENEKWLVWVNVFKGSCAVNEIVVKF